MSLPWNPHFRYIDIINQIKTLSLNPTITRKQLDELIALKDKSKKDYKEGDQDVFEFLEVNYFSPRTGKNGYRGALNLCIEEKKKGPLKLTAYAKELLQIKSY